MSIRIMSGVWSDAKQTGSHLLILLALADFSNDKGQSYPSITCLAKKARMSPRWTQMAIRKLVADKEIEVLECKGPYGCNVYSFLKYLPPETPKEGGADKSGGRGEYTAPPLNSSARGGADDGAPYIENRHNKPSRGVSPPKEVEFWNANCGTLPKVLKVSEKRKRAIESRRGDDFWVDNFERAVLKIAASAFCNGATERGGWRASFDWLVEQPDTVLKVMEGKYDNRENTPNGNGRSPWKRPTPAEDRNSFIVGAAETIADIQREAQQPRKQCAFARLVEDAESA